LLKLGLTFEELLTLSPEEQFFAIADALGKIQNPSERAAAGVSLFGKGFRELNPLIASGETNLKNWTAEAENAGVIIDELTRQQMTKFDDSWEQLKTRISVVTSKALTPFVEYLNGVFKTALDGRTQGLEKFFALMKAIRPDVGQGLYVSGTGNTSEAEAKKKEEQDEIQRQNDLAIAAAQAEHDAFWKEIARQAANDRKKAAAASVKVGKAAGEAGGKAKAEAEIDSYAKAIATAKQDLDDAKRRVLVFDTSGEAGLEVLEKQLDLRDKIARAVGTETDPERIKALTDYITKQQELNDILEHRRELREQDIAAAEKAKEADKEFAEQTREAWKRISEVIADSLSGVITGARSAKEAVLELVEAILQAIVKAAILAAFGQGTFGGNLKSGFGFPTGKGAGPVGPQVRVYNYGQSPGGVVARTSSDGSVDLFIGQIAKAISTGGNQLDNALRRTYGMRRVGV
jgi:hypothetical protein